MLHGDKVTLRAIERADQAIFWAYNNDLELELLFSDDPPSPVSMARMEAFFDKRTAEAGPNHWFTIEANGKVIGACGLMGFDATARVCVLGIRIGDRTYWGRGYGRDAVRTIADYGFRHLNMHRIWLTVLVSNQRAIRSYRACGFQVEARLRRHIWVDGSLQDEVLMGLLRADWPPDVSSAD
jgi:RimJ/RimL family protein N-acetyltransferase